VDADLDTLATALYVTTDDLLKAHPEQVPWRPAVGIQPRVTDAEIITLAVMQALLSFTSEERAAASGRPLAAGRGSHRATLGCPACPDPMGAALISCARYG
jgi:hypothetical protein